MDKVLVRNINELEEKETNNGNYMYKKKNFVKRSDNQNCIVAVYTIPPQKAGYPYHYHLKNDETFYIISGIGLLRTPQGERQVSAGDLIYFPANECGAHKLTNISENENLVYIDFDLNNDIDVSLYPDSEKIAIWGKNTNKVFKINSDVDYYDGE